MISGLLVFNQAAELIISRFYKSDYSKAAVEAFRIRVISNKNFGSSPVMLMEKYSFIYIKSDDLILVAMTRKNTNVNLAFEFLYSMCNVFKSYFEGEFNQESIRSNFVLVYELLDEIMDWGYPQIVDTSLLKGYIHHGVAKEEFLKKNNLDVMYFYIFIFYILYFYMFNIFFTNFEPFSLHFNSFSHILTF